MNDVEKKKGKKIAVDESFLKKVLEIVDGFTDKFKELFDWRVSMEDWKKGVDSRFNEIQEKRKHTIHPPFYNVPIQKVDKVVMQKHDRKNGHQMDFEIYFKDDRAPEDVVVTGKKVQEEIEEIVMKYRVKKLNVNIDL